MKDRARYVVFDGVDGSSTSTQLQLLRGRLEEQVVFTREPGGTPFAEEIHKLVRESPLAGQITLLNSFLLFWAAREELQHSLVVPTLKTGRHVFSDRGDSSTYAFQICAEQHEDFSGLFQDLRKKVFFSSGRKPPDLYVIFDLPAEIAYERAKSANCGELSHVRDLAYYRRVQSGFHHFAQVISEPVVFINANQSPEEMHRSVCMALAANMIIPDFAFD